MHGNANLTKENMTKQTQKYVCSEIISKLSPLSKVEFKVTPIERQSL